jgi:hypothetical protein
MFIVGLILLVVGACVVYGTGLITRLVPGMGQKHELRIKFIGLTCAVAGAVIIFRSEIPSYLKIIR